MHLPRTRAVALLSVATLTLAAAPAGAAPAPDVRASQWQGKQVDNGQVTNVEYGFTDWGLTVDTGLMLAASGTHRRAFRTLKNRVRNNRWDYIGRRGERYVGPTAKLLFAARVWKAKVRDYGGTNLRARLRSLQAPRRAGSEWGRFRDVSQYGDYSTTFTQAYAVLGLARTGGVPQPAVSYLLKQRCRNGRFRDTMTRGTTCTRAGSPGDVDSTALAVQALVAAKASGARVPTPAITGSGRWLMRRQADNGAFTGSTTPRAFNTNSTGLAALALRVTRHPRAARKAGRWVRTMQLTPARAKYRRDIGAIAYSRSTRNSAMRRGIKPNLRDSYRRATPQAYFALNRVPFTTLAAR